jgi:MFS family permease
MTPQRHQARGTQFVITLPLLTRGVLVLAMVLPGMPLAALIVLLFLVTLVGAPFQSARSAIVPDVLPGEAYILGTAVTMTTLLLSQFAGFAAGGVVVSAFGVRTSLVVGVKEK